MRALLIGIAILAAASTPALANGIRTTPGHLIPYATMSDASGAGIPTVNRGDQFAIACNDITAATADVRVVMSLDGNEAPTGYSAVLATNQTIARHSVRVQVPDLPDFGNHTVNVKVYVTDAKGTRACDAGRLHIG